MSDLNKQGVDLATAILTKQANEIKQQSDALAQEQSNETERNPEGTINEVRDQIVAQGAAKGAVSPDGVTDKVVGSKEDDKKPEIKNEVAPKSDLEKAAAVSALIQDHGHDFEEAVNMVKQASEEIETEELELIKIAATQELINQGFDISSAVAAIDAELNKG